MKLKTVIVLVLMLPVMSCEPFMLSMFPGYLPDLVASADMSGYFRDVDVEHYELCAMFDGTRECVFLQAQYYSGARRLLVFNDALQIIHEEINGDFGSRHLVDISDNFVIGQQLLNMSSLPAISLDMTNNPGSYGFGGVINGFNTIIDRSGDSVVFRYYNDTWAVLSIPPPDTFSVTPAGMAGNYELIYSRWFPDLDLTSLSVSDPGANVLIFRDTDDTSGNMGFAVVIDQSTALTASYPSLIGGPAPCHTIPLGPISWEAWVMSAGIMYRTRDGALQLRLWDGTLAAATRDIAPEGELCMDYGYVDNYYLFDPDSKKLFKAMNWW